MLNIANPQTMIYESDKGSDYTCDSQPQYSSFTLLVSISNTILHFKCWTFESIEQNQLLGPRGRMFNQNHSIQQQSSSDTSNYNNYFWEYMYSSQTSKKQIVD